MADDAATTQETVSSVLNDAIGLMATEIRAIRAAKGANGRILHDDRTALLEMVRELRGIETTRSQLLIAMAGKLSPQAAEELTQAFIRPRGVIPAVGA